MKLPTKLYQFLSGRSKLRLSPMQIIAVTFACIILVGMLLLTLPVSSRSGESCGVLPALFTATSATCVTGLVLFDTWTQWSGFGQAVILCMIELGGLGFMSAASLVVFLFRKKVGLRQRMVIAQALSLNDMDGVVKLQKMVLFGSLSVQFVGALILFCRFLPEYGPKTAAIWGVFHAVSAFCNAGFDIVGSVAPGANMIFFQKDPLVLFTLMALIVVGGLGFFVWEEVVRIHNWRKFSVYTKLVLLMTGALIIVGMAFVLLLEWDNPGTLGPMPWPLKILNALFQSVTVRTAGFGSVDQMALTDGGKAVSMVLMLIGGSSGSTAGGVKMVTMLVLALFVWSRLRGRDTVCVFKRTVPQKQVMDAMTIAFIMLALAVFGGIFISATSAAGFVDSLYEAVSALATVGLTAGVTTQLTLPAQILIILYMYFGRVGILTLSLGFLMSNRAQERYRYANTTLLIG